MDPVRGGAGGASPSTPLRRSDRPRAAGAWITEQVAAQRSRLVLWTPVAAGLGAATYFALTVEPSVWIGLAGAVVAIASCWAAGKRDWVGYPVLLLAALFALGFAGATLRSRMVASPITPRFERPVAVEGWVVEIGSAGQSGPRLEIAPTSIDGVAPDRLPVRLRLTARSGEIAAPGEAIRTRAILNPPPGPASPGAYDFARDSYFRGIGGVGVALTPLERADPPEPPWQLRLQMAVNAARWALSRRIHTAIGGSTGGVAVAMTTGHEAFVDEADVDAMRDSGLAHVLSISGLHMAVVGGFVFFMVRLLIAAIPALALRINGKKAAAWAGLLAVAGYLVLSGAPAPAVRSAITAAVAFGAILLDRRAISLRALAIAALVVMALQPEAVVGPGFQMSFAATAALVALAEMWPARIREISAPWPIVTIQRGLAWLGGAVAASFVAGLATTPFAVQHFNRIALYGLPANLVTEPLTAFVIMPFLAVGAALAPVGLGDPFLWVAGQGVDLMLAVARFAAEQPRAVILHASGPNWTLALAFVGVLWLCLWRGPLRWAGLVLACAVVWWPRPTPPDLWISGDAANVAVRVGDGAQLARPNSKRFAGEIWARRRGLELAETSPFLCQRDRCLPGFDAPPVALWSARRAPDAEAMTALCGFARVVVIRTERPERPPACANALVIDGATTAERGAGELWATPDGSWRIVWANDDRRDRPWSGGQW